MRHDKNFIVKLASTFIVLLLLPIVTVSAEPTILVANFSTNVTSGYSPFTVQFNDNTENATAWYWDFGDGSNSTEQSPIHTYSTVGNYTVTLTVSYTNSISKIITIVVSPQPILPVANFMTNATSGYVPLSIQFIDSSENATAWYWDFGDGSNSAEQNPMHTFYAAGNYSVNLVASNENGTDSKLATIAVQKSTPVINWNNPDDIIYGTALGNTQLNAIASVPGTFDYTPATGTALSAGTHILHADFIPDDAANNTVESKNVTINVLKSIPIINWNNPDDIIYGTALGSTQLNATASVPGSFDYTPATGTVLDIGVHTLHIDFAPDDTANYSIASKNVTITISAQPILPVANFITNVTSGYAPLSVQFNDSSLHAIGWSWDFGDGLNSTEQNPIHTFYAAGNYSVNLVASNENGTDSKLATIAVQKSTPVINWNNPDDIIYGTALGNTQLNATASVPGSFDYTPATGTVLDIGVHTLHVDFTPADAANYTMASKNVTITISSQPVLPVANFTTNVTSGYAPLSVQFNDSSLHAIGWSWDFGDGLNSTEQNPTHTFSSAGNYTIKLTASNEHGSDLTSSTIVVLPKKTIVSNETIEWGSSIRYDSGGSNSLAVDDSGHCIETHIGTGRLFYRMGNVIPTNNTINWGSSIIYDSGSSGAISMDNSGHCIEIHNGTGRLFYRVGTVNFANDTISWGPSIGYDTGGPNSISMDDSGHCIEVHVGTARLFYRVGTVNFANNTISWGPSIRYDSGGPNSISMDDSGRCTEVHVGTGRLFYRAGVVNFAKNTINWGPSIRYDTGGPNSISMDNSGRCIETHVGAERLFYRVGKVNL